MSIDIDKTITEYNELRLIIIEEQKRVQQEVLPLLEAAKKEYKLSIDNFEGLAHFTKWAKVYSKYVINKGI